MRDIMVEATARGHRLMRNNIGRATYVDNDGSITGVVPYGVGGKGGSDLIGWTARRIHDHAMLSTWRDRTLITSDATYPIPVFTVVETKYAKGKKRKEQERFIEGVKRAGGIAGFCFSVDDYLRLIGELERSPLPSGGVR